MKRKITFIITLILCTVILQGCQCKHTESRAATCTTPQICTKCGEITGPTLPHDWEDATCIRAKTCKVCQITEGTALDHNPGQTEKNFDFVSASVIITQTCLNCNSSLLEETIPMDSFIENHKFKEHPINFLSG